MKIVKDSELKSLFKTMSKEGGKYWNYTDHYQPRIEEIKEFFESQGYKCKLVQDAHHSFWLLTVEL